MSFVSEAENPLVLPANLSPAEVLAAVVKALEDKQAVDVVTLDLAGRTPLADFMVIATGNSDRQVKALADAVEEATRDMGIKGMRPEGLTTCHWVLMDLGDVIVHLFLPEARQFYNLEKLWTAPASEAFEADQ